MRGGKVLTIRGAQLGKFARRRDTGEMVWVADVSRDWRDPHIAGWSLNYALVSEAAVWGIEHFYLRPYTTVHRANGSRREYAATLHTTLETLNRHGLAAGCGPWGQNLTLPDRYWKPADTPATDWIAPTHQLTLQPLYCGPERPSVPVPSPVDQLSLFGEAS